MGIYAKDGSINVTAASEGFGMYAPDGSMRVTLVGDIPIPSGVITEINGQSPDVDGVLDLDVGVKSITGSAQIEVSTANPASPEAPSLSLKMAELNGVFGTVAGVISEIPWRGTPISNTLARRTGTGQIKVANGVADDDTATFGQLNARLSAAQRSAINALDAGTATVADVVNALKAT